MYLKDKGNSHHATFGQLPREGLLVVCTAAVASKLKGIHMIIISAYGFQIKMQIFRIITGWFVLNCYVIQ
jgi:hypothetical protein